MGRRTDACAGRENAAYREAWDAHDAAYKAWLDECESALDGASQRLSDLAGDEDGQHDLAEELGLPEPPEPPDIEPVSFGDKVWCPRCHRQIRHALADIGDLAAVLAQWADGHRGAQSGEKIHTRHAAAPSPSPITDTLDELYGALAEVEQNWRDFAGHPPRPNRARTGDARQRTLAYLGEQLDRILLHPGSVAFGQAALAWQRRLQHLTRTDPVVRRRPGRCPRCALVNTLQTRDDGYTECRSCGRLLNEEEYGDLVDSADDGLVAESRAERRAS